MEILINNHNDLLEFIKRKDIPTKQATEIVCKALNVICLFETTKEELLKDTEYYINKFCQNNSSERPIFLGQLDLDFDIKDVFKN
jgi:hypothetical protein